MPQFNGKQEGQSLAAGQVSQPIDEPRLRCPRNGQTDESSAFHAEGSLSSTATERLEQVLGKAMKAAPPARIPANTVRLRARSLVSLMHWRGSRCWHLSPLSIHEKPSLHCTRFGAFLRSFFHSSLPRPVHFAGPRRGDGQPHRSAGTGCPACDDLDLPRRHRRRPGARFAQPAAQRGGRGSHAKRRHGHAVQRLHSRRGFAPHAAADRRRGGQ